MWLGFCVALVAPSPKFQLYVYGAVPPVAEPVKFSVSGALPVVGEPVALAESGVEPWTQKSSSGSPSAAWSAVVIGKVDEPRLSFGSMTPECTFSIVRSIAATTLPVVYATCETYCCLT